MKRSATFLATLALCCLLTTPALAAWYDYFGKTWPCHKTWSSSFSLALDPPYEWSPGSYKVFTLTTGGGWDLGYAVDFDLNAGEGVDVAQDGYSNPQLMSRFDVSFAAKAWLEIVTPFAEIDFWGLAPINISLRDLLGTNLDLALRLEAPTIDYHLPFRDDGARPLYFSFEDGIYAGDYKDTIFFDLSSRIPIPGIEANLGTALGLRGNISFWFDNIAYYSPSQSLIGVQRSAYSGADLSSWPDDSVTVARRDYGFLARPYLEAGVALYLGFSVWGFTLDRYYPAEGSDPPYLVNGWLTTDVPIALPVTWSKTYQLPGSTEAVNTPDPDDPWNSGDDSGSPTPQDPPDDPVQEGITVTSPLPGSRWSIADQLYVGWNYPSDAYGIVTVELFRNGVLLRTLGTATGRTETFMKSLGSSLEPGDGYTVKVSNAGVGYGFSGSFTIIEERDDTGLTPISSASAFQSMSQTGDYYLTQDINFGGQNFTPIPYFKGTLDGRGHTIRNFDIEQSGSATVGIFRVLDNPGIIKNLYIEDVDVRGQKTVGLVAGEFDAEIINVHSINCDVRGDQAQYNDAIGGLVGTNSGTIVGSSVTGDSMRVRGYGNSVGGIVGEAQTGSVIKKCWVVGYTVRADSDGYTVRRTGGIVGTNWGNGVVQQCYTNISNLHSDDYYLGGIVGDNSGTVEDCYSNGNVDAEGDLGGIAGANDGTVRRCYATGHIDDRDGYALIGRSNGAHDSVWNTETTGVSAASPSASTNTIGATTAQMKLKATYTALGWDFDSVWTIDEGNGYPTLLGAGPPSGTPSGLTASSDNPLGIQLQWSAGENGYFHRVYRSTTQDGTAEPITLWITGTSYFDNTAIPGMTYWYTVVSARTPQGDSPSAFLEPRVSGKRLKQGVIIVKFSFEAAPADITAPGTAGAAWNIDGAGTYNSGQAVSRDAPATYQVGFSPVSGWVTPAAQSVELDAGATRNLSATYLLPRGSVRIDSPTPGLNDAGGRWRLAGGLWRRFGETVTGVVAGQRQIEFLGTDSYAAPESIILTVTQGTLSTTSVEYTERRGNISLPAMLLLLLQ